MDERHVEVEGRIRSAFRGVSLENGVSIMASLVIDNGGPQTESGRVYSAGMATENRDDWTALSSFHLEELQAAWLDIEGFRFYLPAMMLDALRLLDEEVGSEWSWTQLWVLIDQRDARFKSLTVEQQQACAHFVKLLPHLVEGSSDEGKVLERRLTRQWEEFIPLSL